MTDYTIKQLWELPPNQFNQWRRENDLLKLFRNFKKNLPFFEEWMQEFQFDIEYLLKVDNPREFFHGDRSKFLLEIVSKEIISVIMSNIDQKRNYANCCKMYYNLHYVK